MCWFHGLSASDVSSPDDHFFIVQTARTLALFSVGPHRRCQFRQKVCYVQYNSPVLFNYPLIYMC
jgi:hypothetical protein